MIRAFCLFGTGSGLTVVAYNLSLDAGLRRFEVLCTFGMLVMVLINVLVILILLDLDRMDKEADQR